MVFQFVGALPILHLRMLRFPVNCGLFVLFRLLMEWVTKHRDAESRFLREENRILRERLD